MSAPSSPAVPLSLDDVEAAARRLGDRVRRTPVIVSASLDEAAGARVFLKCENLQRAGSFKIRGAFNKIATLVAGERGRGVVAFSSGNHAQGVALAARMLGTSAVICMPEDAPALKVAATRGYGADVVFYDRFRDDREAMGRRIAGESGRVLVPPYDDYLVMAGQGTAALELLRETGPLDALVTPVGGGGLMAGCSTVARALVPGAAVIGVEAESANDTYLSLARGERVTIPPPATMADGIRVTTPGALTFPVLQERVSRIALVSEEEIAAAVRFLALRAKLVAEPTGAVGVAALLAGRLGLPKDARIGVVISGGNVDPDTLCRLLLSARGSRG